MSRKHGSIPLLDRYLITQLIPNLIFAIAICTILSELIGISFEQVKFVATEGLPWSIVAMVHLLKLPAFVSLSLPLSLLMATIITYSKLSANREIIALQSYGVSLLRLLFSPMAIALCLTLFTFGLNELVVPTANYQTAIRLENEWGVDRTKLAKYNKQEIVYQQFAEDKIEPTLKYLFFADRFDGKYMHGITLLKYRDSQLQTITTAEIGQWREQQQHWQLSNGNETLVNSNSSSNYIEVKEFKSLALPLTKDIFNYANHHRDHREMSILALYERLDIIRHSNNSKNIRTLQISIQERYALPFSCIAFTLLGSVLGIATAKKTQSAGLTISAVAIFLYYAVQFIATSLTTSGVLPVFLGVWLPNIVCLSLVAYLLMFSTK